MEILTPEVSQVLLGLMTAGIGWLLSQVVSVHRHTKDLHEWHAPVDGVQSWKGDPKLMHELLDKFGDQLAEIRRQGERQDEMLAELRSFREK